MTSCDCIPTIYSDISHCVVTAKCLHGSAKNAAKSTALSARSMNPLLVRPLKANEAEVNLAEALIETNAPTVIATIEDAMMREGVIGTEMKEEEMIGIEMIEEEMTEMTEGGMNVMIVADMMTTEGGMTDIRETTEIGGPLTLVVIGIRFFILLKF